MEFIKTTIEAVPKRERKSESRFERTVAWTELKKAIDAGMTPGTVFQLLLTPKDMEEYGITNRRTIARFVQKYLSSLNLSYPVKVVSFTRSENVFIVVKRERDAERV